MRDPAPERSCRRIVRWFHLQNPQPNTSYKYPLCGRVWLEVSACCYSLWIEFNDLYRINFTYGGAKNRLKSPPPPLPPVGLKTPPPPGFWGFWIVIFSVIKLSLLFSLYDRGFPVIVGSCLNCLKCHKILSSICIKNNSSSSSSSRGRGEKSYDIWDNYDNFLFLPVL